mmetsp:Transcript_20174/g.31542  ORF Transcript_20174/g.31542 Transcript_20174/m.31542 type:complete len:137 (-) Transcript_20174:1304-1714(-)
MRNTENVVAIIVTTPQEMALLDVRKEISFCQKAGCKILGVVENMAGFVCPHCNETSEIFPPSAGESGAGGESLAKKYNVPFLGRIPLDPRLSRASERGVNAVRDDLESPASVALSAIARNVKRALRGEALEPALRF